MRILCFLAISGMLLSGCNDLMKTDHKIKDSDVVATVNGENLTVDKIRKGILVRKRQFRVGENKEMNPEELLYLKTESMNELILNFLLQQEVKKNSQPLSRHRLRRARLCGQDRGSA